MAKSNPVTAATLPTIFKFLPNSVASLETTARLPDACDISSSENGTLPANLTNVSNALAPSLAEPNKKSNLNPNSSTDLPTSPPERP